VDEPAGQHEELLQVAETREPLEAELIALKLREAGIEAQVLDQSFKQEPMPSVRAFSVVRVLVPASREDEARRVLAAEEPLPEDGETAEEP
jgi:hypothetical protein